MLRSSSPLLSLRVTSTRLAPRDVPRNLSISGYNLFVKTHFSEKRFENLTFREKHEAIRKMWSGIGDAARQRYNTQAKNVKPQAIIREKEKSSQKLQEYSRYGRPILRRKVQLPLGSWRRFVKDNYSKTKHLPFEERMKALRKMYQDTQKWD